MNTKFLTLATAAVIGVSAVSPVFADEAGDMYVKGQFGYTFGPKNQFATNDYKLKGLNFGGGVGYNISDCLRTDLVFSYSTIETKTKKDIHIYQYGKLLYII
mgnify:CR=1 FL=1